MREVHMVNIFLGWSGNRCKFLAESLYEWLPRMMPFAEPWVSEHSTKKGDRWTDAVFQALMQSKVGIFIMTPENAGSAWMNFEVGLLGHNEKNVQRLPLVFGMPPSELDLPLSMFQSSDASKKTDVWNMIQVINEQMGNKSLKVELLRNNFEKNWPDFEEKLGKASTLKIPNDHEGIESVLESFSNSGFLAPNKYYIASFTGGFESHGFYSSAVQVAQNRLWIYGRKNRKLFDKEYKHFFDTLVKRADMGFDFKVLFLNPASSDDVIRVAHADDDFPSQLENSVEKAKELMKSHDLSIDRHFRKYQLHRDSIMMVIDDAVVFSSKERDNEGRLQHLTQAPFSVVGATTDLGKNLIAEFQKVWENSERM